MKHFRSIEKIDTGILYALELTSSISVLLLAFGLIRQYGKRAHERFCADRQSFYATDMGLDTVYCH